MTFGKAVEAMRGGCKVARHAWDGSNKCVVLMPGLRLPAHSSQTGAKKVNEFMAHVIGEDTPLVSQPYLAEWVGNGDWQPGWLPAQADILADDWFIVRELRGAL
jgi:hypothetical protein